MTGSGALELLNDDPIAQQLLTSAIPARLAYIALDGTPRAIPIGQHFTGRSLVMATAHDAPKVAALQADPAVALTIDDDSHPPLVLLIRGVAAVTIVDGVAPEYLAASRRSIPPEAWESFEREVNALYERMARIEITPSWARVFDFQTRMPEAVRRLVEAKGSREP